MVNAYSQPQSVVNAHLRSETESEPVWHLLLRSVHVAVPSVRAECDHGGARGRGYPPLVTIVF